MIHFFPNTLYMNFLVEYIGILEIECQMLNLSYSRGRLSLKKIWSEQDILGFTLYRKALWAASLITKVKPDARTPFTKLKFGPMRRLHAQELAPHWSKLYSYKGCPRVRLSLSVLKHHSFSLYGWPLYENVWLQWGYLTTHHPIDESKSLILSLYICKLK